MDPIAVVAALKMEVVKRLFFKAVVDRGPRKPGAAGLAVARRICAVKGSIARRIAPSRRRGRAVRGQAAGIRRAVRCVEQ
jgi:hypothetical protein